MSLKVIIQTLIIVVLLLSCDEQKKNEQSVDISKLKVRQPVDTIGFTQYAWQMDSIASRILAEDRILTEDIYKAVICPHDDYAYAAGLYNKTLVGIKAKTIVLIGVAHKARKFNLENKLVFGSFDKWKGIYSNIMVSPLRDELLKNIPQKIYVVHDSMMQIEHSLEAITPFLQKNNKEVKIIPLLVPYITFDKMDLFSDALAKALHHLMKKEKLQYGKDIAIVISNDAIHYGDEGWGSDKLAPFGVDSLGTIKARQKDMDIINQCLDGELDKEKVKLFNQYTVQKDNYKEYQWTWCGRYSVPFGLLFANKLNDLIENKPLTGKMIGYNSSYHSLHIEVKDIGMGVTAPANNHHWVAYVGVKYQ